MNELDYLVPDGRGKAEIIVKRSRFIAEAVGISSAEEAREKIKATREEHPGATHVVYAFLAGDARGEIGGMSDDGEPPGTAGKPVMDVLKGSGIFNVLLTVVRYFGGVKLGTGGLVRAYSESAHKALDNMPVENYIPQKKFSLSVPYDLYEKVKIVIVSVEGSIEKEEFSGRVNIEGYVPVSGLDACNTELKNISHGKVFID